MPSTRSQCVSGQRQRIQTAAKQQDPQQETGPRDVQQPAAARDEQQSDNNHSQRMVHLVAAGGLEVFQVLAGRRNGLPRNLSRFTGIVSGESAVDTMCPERSHANGDASENGAQSYPPAGVRAPLHI